MPIILRLFGELDKALLHLFTLDCQRERIDFLCVYYMYLFGVLVTLVEW